MAFTQRHFELVARTIKLRADTWLCDIAGDDPKVTQASRELLVCLARDFADAFKADNPRFDRDRFMKACGLEQ